MIKIAVSFVIACAALAAAEPAARKAAQPKTAVKGKASQKSPRAAISIPAAAREIEPGTFLHMDADGKRWMYRRTPFGVSRWEDKQEAGERSAAEKAQLEATSAVEEGDRIRFSRPGPFGTYKWIKKKDELDADEQAVWKREQERSAAAKERKPE
jgi:hypothetical protein